MKKGQTAPLPAESEKRKTLRRAECRLGRKAGGENSGEALLFLRAGGFEIGYYTLSFGREGWFVDFTYYDESKEARAVAESFAPCGEERDEVAEAVARDLSAMGYYIPRLGARLGGLGTGRGLPEQD